MTLRRHLNKMRWSLLAVIRVLFRLVGRSWNDFYSWMLDFQDRKVTLDQILSRPSNPKKFKGLWDWARGRYYLEFMIRHGLQPHHHVLDLGCGYGRVAIPLLGYQDGGDYSGTEISNNRLKLAEQWIRRENLQNKRHRLTLSKDNALSFIDDASIDVAWVLSVFNHMPDRELDISLAAIWRVLKPEGRLFCYYLADIEGGDRSVKTFRRSDADMARRLEGLGFRSSHLADWDSDLGDQRPADSRMVLAEKPA